MKKFIRIGIIAVALIVTFLYVEAQKSKVAYAPFALNTDTLKLNIIEPAAIMEGTPEGDLMIAEARGSKIFAKGGLNYVMGGAGNDEFYYSLCSTKIIDDKVNVIEGFDPKHDKLKIFCAHHEILPTALRVVHDKAQGKPVTYVEIQGNHSVSAIALLGNIDIKVSDIVLNERWVSSTN